MPRYAEWNKFIANLKADKYGGTDVVDVGIAFQEATADVVPKSEVELLEREVRLLTENSITVKYPHCVIGSYYAVLTKSLEDYGKVIADISSAAKAEVAREIFEEIEKVMYNRPSIPFLGEDIRLCIAELKKKYTEGESNG